MLLRWSVRPISLSLKCGHLTMVWLVFFFGGGETNERLSLKTVGGGGVKFSF